MKLTVGLKANLECEVSFDLTGIHAKAATVIKKINNINLNGILFKNEFSYKSISLAAHFNPSYAYYYLPIIISKPKILRPLYTLIFKRSFKQFIKSHLSLHKIELEDSWLSKQPQNPILILNHTNEHFGQIFPQLVQLPTFKKKFTTTLIGTNTPQGLPQQLPIAAFAKNIGYKTGSKHKQLKAYQAEVISKLNDPIEIELTKVYFSLFRYHYKRLQKILMGYIDANENMVNTIKPTMILGGDYCDPRCITPFLIAKKLRLPSLVVMQGGLISEVCSDLCFIVSDKVTVWGESALTMLKKIGADANKFVITGHPHYDKYFSGQKSAREIERTILFISQPGHKSAIETSVLNQFKKDILSIFASKRDFKLIIKPHPDDEINWFITEIKNQNLANVELLSKETDIAEQIAKASVVIGFFSTALCEAIVADKPVIIYDKEGKYNRFFPLNYEEAKAAIGVNSPEKLLETIIELENNTELNRTLSLGRKSFIKKTLGIVDGKASERVLEVMLDLMTHSK